METVDEVEFGPRSVDKDKVAEWQERGQVMPSTLEWRKCTSDPKLRLGP